MYAIPNSTISHEANVTELATHAQATAHLPAEYLLDHCLHKLCNVPSITAVEQQFVDTARKVERLILDEKNIEQLSNALSQCTHLKALSVQRNHLTSLPISWEMLTNLVELDLDHNALTQIPNSYTRLCNLRTVSLNHNALRVFPSVLSKMTQLHTLLLAHNQLQQIPESIGELIHLQVLYLNYNQLPQLPLSMGNIKNLLYLSVTNNQLTEVPSQIIRQLRQLQKVDFSHNPLLETAALAKNFALYRLSASSTRALLKIGVSQHVLSQSNNE